MWQRRSARCSPTGPNWCERADAGRGQRRRALGRGRRSLSPGHGVLPLGLPALARHAVSALGGALRRQDAGVAAGGRRRQRPVPCPAAVHAVPRRPVPARRWRLAASALARRIPRGRVRGRRTGDALPRNRPGTELDLPRPAALPLAQLPPGRRATLCRQAALHRAAEARRRIGRQLCGPGPCLPPAGTAQGSRLHGQRPARRRALSGPVR